jgi:hypothetical protein
MIARLVATVITLCASTACLSAETSRKFQGTPLQTAEVSGAHGHRFIRIVIFGDPKLGQAMPTPCEIRVKEVVRERWRLVPFESAFMAVDATDARNASITVRWPDAKTFTVETNFDLCPPGMSFNGLYRVK